MQKIVHIRAFIKIFEERAHRHTRALKDSGATHAVRRTFDGGAILPLQHDTSVGELCIAVGNLGTTRIVAPFTPLDDFGVQG
jgi:hypothetical protein